MDKNVTVTVDMSGFVADYEKKVAPTMAAVEQLLNVMKGLSPEWRRIIARQLSERLAAMAEES